MMTLKERESFHLGYPYATRYGASKSA